jgi:hypothetical protein
MTIKLLALAAANANSILDVLRGQIGKATRVSH